MRKLNVIIGITLVVVAFMGCKKEDLQPVSTPLSFSALTAGSSSIAIGATTTVTATATGEGLSYTWSASAGDIIGSGAQVTYGAPSCCGGQNSVTCVVRDAAGNSQTKSVTITVQ